jgi:hypothetical protein
MNHFNCCCTGALLLAALGCTQSRETSSLDFAEPVATADADLSFQEWKARTRLREAKGIYAVGERISPRLIVGEDDARDYYDRHFGKGQALTLHNGQRVPGDLWTGSYFPPGTVIRYCFDRPGWQAVASDYGLPSGADPYARIVEAFDLAVEAWNNVLGVNDDATIEIRKVTGRDNSCVPTRGDNITWYVRPAVQDEPIEYLTYVLHPKYNLGLYGASALQEIGLSFTEQLREFKVWDAVVADFARSQPVQFDQWFSLQGLMLHTIAQGLGFVDESARGGVEGDDGEALWDSECRDPEEGGIFMSIADTYSVTLHPRSMLEALEKPNCAGERLYDYAISYTDAMGAACQYRGTGVDSLYYCNRVPQTLLQQEMHSCSPVPIEHGSSGSACGVEPNWTAGARAYGTGVLAVLYGYR